MTDRDALSHANDTVSQSHFFRAPLKGVTSCPKPRVSVITWTSQSKNAVPLRHSNLVRSLCVFVSARTAVLEAARADIGITNEG